MRAVAAGMSGPGVFEAIEDARSRFERFLVDEPEFNRLDPEQQALRIALGVA